MFALFEVAAMTLASVQVGPFYTDAPNGIAFMSGDQAVVFRVGWYEKGNEERGTGSLAIPSMTGPDTRDPKPETPSYHDTYADIVSRDMRYEEAAPDASYGRISWKAGDGRLRFEWARKDDAAIGRVTVEAPTRVALRATRPWPGFRCQFTLDGQGSPAVSSGVLWHLHADRPFAEGGKDRLIFDLTPGKPLLFSCGPAMPPPIDASVIDKARKAYEKKRLAASGAWGDFLGAIATNMNFSKVYGCETHRTAHTVSRGWCSPDGQVLFCWDSFFNGLLASLEDPEGAKDTVRAILAAETPLGFVPNFAGRPWGVSSDRSQPPVGAMCVWKIHQRRPDKAFLREVYPKLVKWHEWWFSKRPSDGKPYRDGNGNGLLEWGTETGGLQDAKFESGLDDSPMFDDGTMVGHSMAQDDVGLSSLWAADGMFLALIADEIGKKADAAKFRTQRDEMAKRIDDLMWDEETGMYCNRFWEPRPVTEALPADGLFGEGLKGEYFAGSSFDELRMTRVDKRVDFDWGDTGPDPKLGKTNYTVRWTGSFHAPKAGRYVFEVTGDDGARLWLGERKLVDDWTVHPPVTDRSEPIELTAGEHPIKLEYFQATGGAVIRLAIRYLDPDKPAEHFSRRWSPTNFYPMIAGIPDKRRAQRMLAVLQDKTKFWGEFVCPTITRDDPTFPQQHYWRGKIWAPTNYLMYQGLKRYATDATLNEFARKSVALFMRNWTAHGTCHENFLSNGEGSSDPHYTWGALLCLIGLERLVDILPDGSVRMTATLGEDVSADHIPLFGKLYDLKLTGRKAELSSGGHAVLTANDRTATSEFRQDRKP